MDFLCSCCEFVLFEKLLQVFVAQEQLYLKKLWVTNSPGWAIGYKSLNKRNRLILKLVGNSKYEEINNGEKLLSVYFLGVEVPVWILFFSLGVSSDKEIIDLIDFGNGDTQIINILFASIRDADEKCEGFRKGRNARHYMEEQVKGVQFPPSEPIEECLDIYLFPGSRGLKRKARFLAYMVKSLLLAYTGRRKLDNRDDFRNKRLELAAE